MGDRRVQEIIQNRKEAKKMSQLSKDWEWLKKQKSGYVPFNEASIHDPYRLQEILPDNAWKNQRCFIIGGGKSLKGFNFKQLDRELTIAINRSFESIDPSIIFWMDYQTFYRDLMAGVFGEKTQKKFDSSRALKVTLNISGYEYPPGIYSLRRAIGKESLSFSLKDGIIDGDNSGYAALNLAVCLGANPIYLLGFDMNKSKSGKQEWFHEGYKRIGSDSIYKKWAGNLEKVAPIIDSLGIKVINLNPNSAVKCFEFGTFKDVKKKRKRSGITAITPTGDRPLAFALCQHWMKNQTIQPDQWIVVDDGKVPLRPFIPMQYIRREPCRTDPKHTLIENLEAAIPYIKGSEIIIIEDDEYYAPGYIERITLELKKHEVVGMGKSRYYHLPTGGNRQINNLGHASLAETGFRRSFLPEFIDLLKNKGSFLDLNLWKKAKSSGRGIVFTNEESPLYVGIKGLPGRTGIGRGHDPSFYSSDSLDKTRQVLRSWIPNEDDLNIYMDIIGEESMIKDVTGIVVCCNTKDLMEQVYNSIRRFHPSMHIIIVDGSDPKNPCASYVKTLASNKTKVTSLGYNIGHGGGMCLGIYQAETKYALVFDSDTEMVKSPVRQMLKMMEEDTFGVGWVCKTGFDGIDYGKRPRHQETGHISYLHPYFHLIDIDNYKKYRPYISHGAPCLSTMIDIHKKGLSEKILKDFPDLGDFIKHHHRGTRKALGKNKETELQKAKKQKGSKIKTLAIITRVHPQRPGMLKICVDSVKAQTDDDYIHILHRDDTTEKGYGKLFANQSFVKIFPIPARYVMILDDDDMLIDPDFVKVFREIVNDKNPEIVFFKGIIVGKGVYPREQIWGKAPLPARIASFCWAIKLNVWRKNIHEFGKRHSGGDSNFICRCYENTTKHFWVNRFVAKTQKKPGGGVGEQEHA